MLRVFIGMDQRSPLAYTVLQSSIIRRSSVPVQITPLLLKQLPVERRGLTDFSYSRYIVPYLCGYEGMGMFIDADMIVKCDIKEVFDIAEAYGDAVSVVKHEGKLRFEWSSVMVFNNEKCHNLTLDLIENGNPGKFEWAESIGDLPHEYNHLVGYDEPNEAARIIHYTQGVPAWYETKDCEFADDWHKEKEAATMTCSWKEIMGNSVHAEPVLKRLFAGYQEASKVRV
jgi:hypothetical protein